MTRHKYELAVLFFCFVFFLFFFLASIEPTLRCRGVLVGGTSGLWHAVGRGRDSSARRDRRERNSRAGSPPRQYAIGIASLAVTAPDSTLGCKPNVRPTTQDSCNAVLPLWGVAFLKNPVLGEGTGENKCCILEIVLHHGPERDPTPRSTFRCCGSHWRVPPPRCPRTVQAPRTGTPAGHGHPFRI